jgi:hypothetical protein
MEVGSNGICRLFTDGHFSVLIYLYGEVIFPRTTGLEEFSLFVFAVITGATGDVGWRFLLPRLQTRFGLVATLMVGAVWALWHLPLWFIPGSVWQESIPYWAFALVTISSSFLYTWVLWHRQQHNNVYHHFIMNFASNVVASLGLIPISELTYHCHFIVYTVLIILVFKLHGPRRRSSGKDLF